MMQPSLSLFHNHKSHQSSRCIFTFLSYQMAACCCGCVFHRQHSQHQMKIILCLLFSIFSLVTRKFVPQEDELLFMLKVKLEPQRKNFFVRVRNYILYLKLYYRNYRLSVRDFLLLQGRVVRHDIANLLFVERQFALIAG